jgi:pimeloyl-ACP methyl ester carboxylesterase
MATSAVGFTTERMQVGQTELYLLKGGDGPPCLVLHGFEGHEGWLRFHEESAGDATVFAPSHPGYGHTEAPAWITSVQHQAIFYNWFLQTAGLDEVTLVGSGVGGWIAANMAIMCPDRLRRLVLISPAGIKLGENETLDIFVTPWREVIQRGFLDAERSEEYHRIYDAAPIAEFGGIREAGRVMTMRMCFRPYLYDPALPAMLAKIQVPSLIVWGANDEIIPVECADLFQQAIPGARKEVIDNCGHFAHLDQPAAVSTLVREFAP